MRLAAVSEPGFPTWRDWADLTPQARQQLGHDSGPSHAAGMRACSAAGPSCLNKASLRARHSSKCIRAGLACPLRVVQERAFRNGQSGA